MRLFFVFTVLCTLFPLGTFSQGLKFIGGEQSIEKRTSYNVFSHQPVSFTGKFDIDFNLIVYSSWQIGHIVRIKDKKNNKIYNLFYNGQGDKSVFRLNEEGKSSLIIAEIEKSRLANTNWFNMNIAFDLTNDFISLTIYDQTFKVERIGLPKNFAAEVFFGKSDYIIDVPSFAIKDLSIGDSKRYSFPLRESSGNEVHDSEKNIIGGVSNPEWLINDSYNWNMKVAHTSTTQAGADYNEVKNEVYYFNRDSIFIYNTKTNERKNVAFENECPVELNLATSFIDTARNKLFVYEVYYNKSYDGPTIASLDLDSLKWTVESYENLNKELHHHSYFYQPLEQQFYIFGGFGNMIYNGTLYSYGLSSKIWEPVNEFSGDKIFPRYFSSIGYSQVENTAYLFGGMGNESGEFIVGRKYFYDFYKIDLDKKEITKKWEIPWNGYNVVPARGIVLSDSSSFYALCYPEHMSRSFLKLHRFSIESGEYTVLGDSIPIYSDKITTRARLYYDNHLNSLFALVQESKDDISSSIKVYALASPPISAKDLENYSKSNALWKIFLIIVVVAIICFGVCFLIYRKVSKRDLETKDKIRHLFIGDGKINYRSNAVYLFGEFKVFDRHNRDISHLFSLRLKQVFCLILEHSDNEGITSQRLSNLLWPDKSEDKVKNSRGVTINHLRKALSDVDGVELVYNKGFFKIIQGPDFYCDYTRCIHILSTNLKEDKDELLEILRRGKFLSFSEHPIFDSLKSIIERTLEPALSFEMDKNLIAQNYQATIRFAEAMFNIDPFNDNALAYQIKALLGLKLTEEAQMKYQTFVLEYRKTMNDEYPYSYQDLL